MSPEGGRVAEEVIFNQITTGAANDLERATDLARSMTTRYGFNTTLGLRTFGQVQGNPYLGNLGETPDYSEAMSRDIDQGSSQILETAYQRTKAIILQQKDKSENLAKTLLDIETVEWPQFESLMA